MRIKRLIGIYVALAFILAIITAEIIVSNKYLDEIINSANEIAEQANFLNFNNLEIVNKVNDLDKMWDHHENLLCMITHHNNIEDIGHELTVVKTSQKNDNFDNFINSLNLVIYYAKGYKHVFGINLENLI